MNVGHDRVLPVPHHLSHTSASLAHGRRGENAGCFPRGGGGVFSCHNTSVMLHGLRPGREEERRWRGQEEKPGQLKACLQVIKEALSQ